MRLQCGNSAVAVQEQLTCRIQTRQVRSMRVASSILTMRRGVRRKALKDLALPTQAMTWRGPVWRVSDLETRGGCRTSAIRAGTRSEPGC
jgi:hypothetical protein